MEIVVSDRVGGGGGLRSKRGSALDALSRESVSKFHLKTVMKIIV